jgi:hypothetical protein
LRLIAKPLDAVSKGESMKVKIFSARADRGFRARLPKAEAEAHAAAAGRHMAGRGEAPPSAAVDAYLERIIQDFLDQHPNIESRHVHFTSIALAPSDEDSSPDSQWPVQKSVLILYEDGV